MFGVYIFITQYLQLVLGLSPLHAGLATVPWSLAFVVGSLLAPQLARRVPAVSVTRLGPGRCRARLRAAGHWPTRGMGWLPWSSAPWS